MMMAYLEHKGIKNTMKKLGAPLKKDLGSSMPEGRGIEIKVEKLWRGFTTRKQKNGIHRTLEETPLFDRLPDRTGKPLLKNEIKMFRIGIKYKRSIEIMSRLSGRSIKEVKNIIKQMSSTRKSLI